MPLTAAESDFVAVYIDEYMAVEIGPGSRKLRERGLMGSDISHLLDAFMRENPPRVDQKEVDGRLMDVLLWGQSVLNPPDPPWPDREAAQRRNAEILAERELK